MATVVPIETIAEVLFENSENIPNNIYIEFMNLLKEYHEHGNNSQQIHEYLGKLDIRIQIKLRQYFKKKCQCNCFSNCFFKENDNFQKFIKILFSLFVIIILSILLYAVITILVKSKPPPPLPPSPPLI